MCLPAPPGGVGELCNFLIGCFFVVPAGWLYRKQESRRGALLGCLAGLLISTAASVLINYYVVYPAYTLVLPEEAILGMYQALLPGVQNLFQGILAFNTPLTFAKEALDVLVTFLIYKKLSPVLKGTKRSD